MCSKNDTRVSRDEEVSSGDDESPEVVSSVQMKSEREKEIRELFALKQRQKDEAKEKRKQKLEQLKIQKKVKLALLESQKGEESDDADGSEERNLGISLEGKGKRIIFDEPASDTATVPTGTNKSKKLKRVYPKYNIEVEPLTKLQDPRAATAMSFREKRLAKVPRENCASSVLSYKDKILAKGSK